LALPLPELTPVAGVRLAAAAAGIRYSGRTDLFMAEFAPGTTVAGVFTRNKCPGAPVDWCRSALAGGAARALVVNAGNANVFTGRAGRAATQATAQAAAALTGCAESEVFLASTGVIGQPLPHERITAALPALHAGLKPDGIEAAVRAMMTTDTFAKAATRSVRIGGKSVTITGIAKGSGMIAPDMATMLCFVFTDAAVPAPALQTMLAAGVQHSFNRTTVDSDTSTSDTVLVFATGQAGNAPDAPLADFAAALNAVLLDLALLVVRDGEGASKFIRIDVSGAVDDGSAQRVALSIANSPLVKTAIAGEDANWGRIVMAVGKAGEPADRDTLSVAVGGVWMARNGSVVEGYDEAPVVAHMRGQEIEIAVDLGLGQGTGTAWTCDLTHAYIDINGSYRS
jgi:glutamate N-acetyltransferase/amino-acid N-acetyltransferase